ncbi:MAG: rod-binding protein [Rhodospirillaceae bacterium]|nr:rod-binding protein [Rhodospirillaceae bacterium]
MNTSYTSATTMQADVAMAQAKHMPTPTKSTSITSIRKVAQDFEAFFLGQMLQPMFANLDVEEPFGGGSSEQMWRSLQVDEYGKAVAKNGGIGIADNLVKEMLKMQEGL